MKPLLYHLEYHVQNGYFDRFPKGQAIKMVIGNDGGIQTLHGRGTGSGKVMFSSGKSVLFATDKAKDELKVVFRAYSDDKFLGEAVKIFKDSSFPKRTEVGEPASYTFASDLGFRKGQDLVGAIKSFIRMTSFGENIISDCIKDGESYRVRMTSLIVERNKDPRKNVKPWWVILDGRRLRFSRWLRALEKEDCAKEVFLKVKKSSDGDLPGVSEASLNEDEDETASETVEAALKRDFEFIREFGFQETYDKSSQVNFNNDSSSYALPVDSFELNSNASCYKSKISTSSSQTNALDFEKDGQVKISLSKTVLSSETQPVITRSCSSDIRGSGYLVSKPEKNSQNKTDTDNLVHFDINQATGSNDLNECVSEENKTNDVINYKKLKPDDIFHFERSSSDVLGESAYIDSSGVATLISEETLANDCEIEASIVTGRSFLAETVVREIIDMIIERVCEREFCSLEEHNLEELISKTKEGSSNKVLRVVGYGDTESLMDLSVLGIAKASACVDLPTCATSNITPDCSATSCVGNEEDKEELISPKTIFIRSSKTMPEVENSNEECSSKICKENEYIRIGDLQEQSDVSCILIKCNDQNNLEDRLSYRSRSGTCGESHESNDGLRHLLHYPKDTDVGMKATRSSVNHCISEWLKEDVIIPCFTCDEEAKDDAINSERWKRTIIANDTGFVESGESSSLPRPDDECRPDITYSSDDVHSIQLTSSHTYHSPHAESESNSSYITNESSRVSQITKNDSQEIWLTEEFQGNAKPSQVIDTSNILKNKRRPLYEDTSTSSDTKPSSSDHALQK